MPGGEERIGEMAADETGGAGDQILHRTVSRT
jgi:hypothetical protein